MKRKRAICGLGVSALLACASVSFLDHYTSQAAALIASLTATPSPYEQRHQDYLAALANVNLWTVAFFATGVSTAGFLIVCLRLPRLNDPGAVAPPLKEEPTPNGIAGARGAVIRFSFLGLLVGLAALTPSFLFFSIPMKGVRDIENGGWLTFLVLAVAAFVSVPIGWLATRHRRVAGSYPRFIRSRLILLFCTGGAAFIIAVFVFYAGHFWKQDALRFFLAPPIAAAVVVGLSAFRHD